MTDTADHNDEEIMDWARCPDHFSDWCVYDRKRWRAKSTTPPAATIVTPRHATPQSPEKGTKAYVTLDPLREPGGPKLVGSFSLGEACAGLRRNGYTFILLILSVLTDEEEFGRRVEIHGFEKENNPRKSRMAPRNLTELMEYDFIVPAVPPDLTGTKRAIFIARYGPVSFASLFTVPKSSGTPPPHRIIVNGIPGNKLLQPPPYFTFFSPECIVRRLRALGVFFGFTVDIRHHFYRIPMHRRMARFYAVAPGGAYYVPTVLPMGSTWGPALGQSSTIAMVSYRTNGKDPDLGLVVPPSGIPSILDIVVQGTVVGHIFICIDNIAVVCQDEALRDKWHQRLERNAKICGVHPFKKDECHKWTEENFEFIGVHYGNGKWRHCADRIEKWRARFGTSEGPLMRLDAETLERFVGVLVWDKRLRVLTMLGMRTVFAILKRALRAVDPVPMTNEEHELLNKLWQTFLLNEDQEWSDATWPPPMRSDRDTIVLVTDASQDKWSWVMMVSGRATENPSGVFPTTVAPHIYYKEMYAVVLGLKELVKRGLRGCNITLVGDSTAVIGSIRKRLAPEDAWPMIDEIIRLIVENEWGIDLKWVESDGNVAHSATHDETMTTYREERSWRVATEASYPPPEGGFGKRDRDGKLISK